MNKRMSRGKMPTQGRAGKHTILAAALYAFGHRNQQDLRSMVSG
jgi:hypothetical protein